MGFDKEYASGESLIHLENSRAFKEFEATILSQDQEYDGSGLEVLTPSRSSWLPRKVIAIDGSNITAKVQNGFPGAEGGLVLISIVAIDLTALKNMGESNKIPSPKVFRDMERAHTLEAVLPGCNVVDINRSDETPKQFFRRKVFEALSGKLDPTHESLLETFREITGTRTAKIKNPVDECTADFTQGTGIYTCGCGEHTLYETDTLRIHERFNEFGSNGEVHAEVRKILEVLSLINFLRFFAKKERIHLLSDYAFVMDGPLAIFGDPAWLKSPVEKELTRIDEMFFASTGQHLPIFGIEKSGQYCTHFESIDWTDEKGPKSKFPNQTILAPSTKYAHRNIVYRPEDMKPHGQGMYFGRKIMYKTATKNHAIINTATTTPASKNYDKNDLDVYPRIADIANIVDYLSSYLYEGGFVPLIRAHAHAAIPLKTGGDILREIICDK